MSYDVSVGCKSLNMTSNLRRFFTEFHVHPVDDMNNRLAEFVAGDIDTALFRIIRTPKWQLDEYSASSGWGTWMQGLEWLIELRDACLTHPDATVQADQ